MEATNSLESTGTTDSPNLELAADSGRADSAYAWLPRALQSIHQAQWYRSPQVAQVGSGAQLTIDGRALVNFASNDYLGLAGDRRLAAAAIAAIQTEGTGATGSRLISGQRPSHVVLEQSIARLKQTEAAIVFSSGYLANVGTIAALVGPRDGIWSDQYNHSSLLNGAKLSGAAVQTYEHADLADLRSQLAAGRSAVRRGLILTDSVFSMDGDLAPLAGLLALAAEFDCMVLVDEAHATGVFGPTGAGAVEHLGLTGQPMIQVGTLSKALGSLGGYVAGSAALIDFLRNRAATWVYTTGLSPADTAAAQAAIDLLGQEPERRDRLWHNVEHLRLGLAQVLAAVDPAGSRLRLLPTDSPILCLQVARPAIVLAWGQALRAAGFFVGTIRPPTVPTSRLRLTVRADHSLDQIDRLLAAIADLAAAT